MKVIIRKLLLCVGSVAALGCSAVWADPSAASCGSVTGAQRRIVERADQSVEALRGYVRSRTVVNGLDMVDVKDSIDTWRAAVACQREVAAAEAAVEMAKTQADPADKVLTAGR